LVWQGFGLALPRVSGFSLKRSEYDFINNSLNELTITLKLMEGGVEPTFRGDMGNMLLRSIQEVFRPNTSLRFVIPISPVESNQTCSLHVLEEAHEFIFVKYVKDKKK